MKKRIIAAIMTMVMTLGLAACGTKSAGDSDIDYIKEKGTLVVGITDFAPMDYKDDAGEWIGFDADLAKKVAESLGVGVEFVEIDWDNKILELQNKSIDVVWNGMTLTDEVKGSMECTEAYLNNAQVVVVPASDAASSGSRIRLPLSPSTMAMVPLFRASSSAGTEISAGMFIIRARIEVWELAEPFKVTKARIFALSIWTVSEGVRSSATIMEGSGILFISSMP